MSSPATHPSFEEAIAMTQVLLVEFETLPESALSEKLAALVASENGARGFFVTYLTDDRPFADRPTAGVIEALRSSPEGVTELLVKNLAMSTAMAIAHRRQGNEVMAAGSDRVQRRSRLHLERLGLAEVSQKAAQLQASAETGTGAYGEFLNRWGYDEEQRRAIGAVLADLLRP
jgi:hypothetical protein